VKKWSWCFSKVQRDGENGVKEKGSFEMRGKKEGLSPLLQRIESGPALGKREGDLDQRGKVKCHVRRENKPLRFREKGGRRVICSIIKFPGSTEKGELRAGSAPGKRVGISMTICERGFRNRR